MTANTLQPQASARPCVAGRSSTRQPGISTSHTKRVRLVRSGQYITIPIPHSDQCLDDRLYTTVHRSVDDAEFGSAIDRVPQLFAKPAVIPFYGEVWSCFGGLLPAVIRVLTEEGYEVDASDLAVEQLPERQRIRHRQGEVIDDALLDFVRHHDRGLVRHSSCVDTSWLVLQIARAWPNLSIAVAVNSWSDATSLAKTLQARGLEVTLASQRRVPSEYKRVLVATDAFLSRHDVVKTRDILIVLDASVVGPNMSFQGTRTPRDHRRMEFIQRARNARLFGFLEDKCRLAPLTRDFHTALFGFEGLHIPQHGRVVEAPEVVSIRFDGGVRCGKHDSLNVHRQGIWRFPKRNQFVRRLCREIQTRQFDALPLREAESLLERLADSMRIQIGVLAANLEHACRLGRCMPDAALVAKTVSGQRGLSERDQRWASERHGRDANLFIITPAALKQARDLDVLIRADGGGLDLRKAINVYDHCPPCVIDIQDRHHPLLRQCRNQRMEQYREAGWNVVGEAEADPVSTFLATRGQVSRRRGEGRRRRTATMGYTSWKSVLIRRSPEEVVAAAKQPTEVAHLQPLVFDQVFSRQRLFDCFENLSRWYGPAPGIDNIAYDDLSPTEVGQIVEHTSQVVLAGRFKPFPPRPVDVPKKEPGEFRTLLLGVIRDRVVGKALQEALSLYFEHTFLEGSHGFRTGRSPHTLLAALEARMVATGNRVLAFDDVRKAFDNVDINACVAAHEQLFRHDVFNGCEPDEVDKFLHLIEVVLRAHDQTQNVGIRQGEPFSPMAMNVLLHVHLDRPLEESGVNWFRYADNLLYLTPSETEGRNALRQVAEHLDGIGMELKGDPGTAVDLSLGATVSLLGVDLQWHEDRMSYSVSERSWDDLRQTLEATWDLSGVGDAAQDVVEGWLAAFGWTFRDRRQLIADLMRCAAECGIRELDPRRLRHLYQRSHANWRQCRTEAFQRSGIR